MADPVTVAAVTNAHIRRRSVRRVAALTSRGSGARIINALDAEAADEFVSFRYLDPADRHSSHADGMPIEQLEDLVARRALHETFGVVVLDPFHTFESSERALRLAFRLLEPGGLVVAHDIAPPHHIAEIDPPDRVGWAGTTYLVFREMCDAVGAAWCTIDADIGIGVARRPQELPTSRLEQTVVPTPAPDELRAGRDRYADDPVGFMRLVPADLADLAVATLAAGSPLEPVFARAAAESSAARALVTALDRDFWLWTNRLRRVRRALQRRRR